MYIIFVSRFYIVSRVVVHAFVPDKVRTWQASLTRLPSIVFYVYYYALCSSAEVAATIVAYKS